ncbi:hypothetical protein B0H16DRAFT_1703476 [Mycena metata]|uniref:Uncharacterized protein n=1 Tax=Mycena metata TaxID=1033252 RepID=A0AAD7H415_9AGAR|nr:hypothetical protein B0H16DRAFT_1703476 [Mycena metata]
MAIPPLNAVTTEVGKAYPSATQPVSSTFFALPVAHSKLRDAGGMVLTSEQYDVFKTTHQRFLAEKNFGFVQTEAAMATVFGLNRSSKDAQIWKEYWHVLGIEHEKMENGDKHCLVREL